MASLNLTVIVPFYQDHATIFRLLESLPPDLPVLLVDDVSDRRSLLDQEPPGLECPAGRNSPKCFGIVWPPPRSHAMHDSAAARAQALSAFSSLSRRFCSVGKRVFGAVRSRLSNGGTWISASINSVSNAPTGMDT